MIKNILFDMGGVVFLQDTEEALKRFKALGLIDTDKYMGAYGQKDIFLDIETGAIDDNEFCTQLSSIVNHPVSWKEAQHCWLGFIKEVPVERLHYLFELKKKYHVCLLSNTNPFIMNFTRSENFSSDGKPISYYFDREFCSYEMKEYKPNSSIFLKAMETDGMKPDETLFVDDSIKNIHAAEALGIKTISIKTNENWINLVESELNKI